MDNQRQTAASKKERIANFLLELFFPSFCLGCNKEGILLCQDCISTLDISMYNYCLCSKHPLRLINYADAAIPGTCQRCKHNHLDGIYSALPYKEKALTQRLVQSFKYRPYLKSLAQPLSQVVIEHLVAAKNNANHIWQDSLLVPVPLAKRRLKQRNYNQSEELAHELSKVLNLEVTVENLVKIKETMPQMKLSAKERSKNLADAFFVKNPGEFKGKKVFLVDDVYTTGSTMQECAKVLKAAGAKIVWGIAIARDG